MQLPHLLCLLSLHAHRFNHTRRRGKWKSKLKQVYSIHYFAHHFIPMTPHRSSSSKDIEGNSSGFSGQQVHYVRLMFYVSTVRDCEWSSLSTSQDRTKEIQTEQANKHQISSLLGAHWPRTIRMGHRNPS